jgi:hypothetical protein
MNHGSRLFSYGSSASFYKTAQDGTIEDHSTLRRSCGVSETVERISQAKNITIHCFIVYEFYRERIQAENELSRILATRSIQSITSVVQGFEYLPGAIVSLYSGSHFGRAQVSF